MTYFGGKTRQAKEIVSTISKILNGPVRIAEPFCGGCSVTLELYIQDFEVVPSDNNLSLILMIQAIQEGWIPKPVSKSLYDFLRKSDSHSAVKGWAGVCQSYCGKWFGGYVEDMYTTSQLPRNYIDERLTAIVYKFQDILGNVQFYHRDYRDTQANIYYLDPPYKSSPIGYHKKWGNIDSKAFLKWAERKRLSGSIIFLSEYTNELGWDVVLNHDRKSNNGNLTTLTTNELLLVGLPPNKT